jgi:hypothetical protein
MAGKKGNDYSGPRVFLTVFCALTGAKIFPPLGDDPMGVGLGAGIGTLLGMLFVDLIYRTILKSNSSDEGLQEGPLYSPTIEVYNSGTGELVGEITEGQMKFILEWLDKGNEGRDTYYFYINRETLDFLASKGADEDLFWLLRKILSEREGINIGIGSKQQLVKKLPPDSQNITTARENFEPVTAGGTGIPVLEGTLQKEAGSEAERPLSTAWMLEGLWKIATNDHMGLLEFCWKGNFLEGRLKLGLHGQWEGLESVHFDPVSGRVEFARPMRDGGERFVGKLLGDKIEGGFMHTSSSKTSEWSARRRSYSKADHK